MADDPENPPQSHPCIPSPRHTPHNRPHTPTAALTGLQAARAPQTPPPRTSLAATTFAPRVHHGPVPPHPARHSVPPHPARPPQRVGWSPQRPRPTSAAAACLARHLQRSHARPNRHLAFPPCGAPEGDLPEPRRWKVAVGVGRGARVATSRFGAPAAAASANAAVPRTMQPGTPH